jgi:hypothetical protein
MMGRSFQAESSTSEVGGTEVGVFVRVGSGVIGENCLGFCVAVGCKTGAASSASSLCVGVLVGTLVCVGNWVVGAAQEATRIHIAKIGTNKRLIRQSISGKN